jgi:penicillin-binding protein 2
MTSAFAGQTGGAIVLRVSDGNVLAMHDQHILAQRIATPGSAIKPFVLELLLEKGLVKPNETISCHRPLLIAGRSLTCSHPVEISSFNAEDALAYSCNTYFVTAAARLAHGDLERRFEQLNFAHPSGLLPNEGEGRLTPEHSLADRQLLAVGAAGIQITPLELAAAYLKLARIDPAHATAAQQTVLSGLRSATDYGLAQAAKPSTISVAGKTGTAADPTNPQTHAWFAGFAPADHPEIVVVVFVERGHGSAEAATIARRIFEAYAEQRQ